MNREDDTPVNDTELAPYLEGKDGVSETYRRTSTEMPSASLDAGILQAARASLHARPVERSAARTLRNYYPIAASLMLGMMLGVVLFNDREETTSLVMAPAAVDDVDASKAAETAEQSGITFAAPQVQALTAADNVAEASAEQATTDSGFRERTLPPPLPPIVTRNVITTSISPFRDAASAAARAGNDNATATTPLVFNFSYRDDPQQWLREIARLDEELEEVTEELAEAASELVEVAEDKDMLRKTLELERAEFRSEHPNVNLDQALSALQGR